MRKLQTFKPTLLILAALILFPFMSSAQSKDNVELVLPAAIYVDLSTLIFVNNISINYDHPLSETVLLRAGVGTGGSFSAGGDGPSHSGRGILLMANYLTPGKYSHLELGAGLSLNQVTKDYSSKWGEADWKLLPNVVLGYRYHPYSGGVIFRTGVGFTYAFGQFFHVSLGCTL